MICKDPLFIIFRLPNNYNILQKIDLFSVNKILHLIKESSEKDIICFKKF